MIGRFAALTLALAAAAVPASLPATAQAPKPHGGIAEDRGDMDQCILLRHRVERR